MIPIVNNKNGVKQGGVAATTLFNIYLDELYKLLIESGYDCHTYIGNHYMEVVGYADDLGILSPQGLTHMVKLCEQFAIEYHIIFNEKNQSYLVTMLNVIMILL